MDFEISTSAIAKVATDNARQDWKRYANVARCELLAAQNSAGFFGTEQAAYLEAYKRTLVELAA